MDKKLFKSFILLILFCLLLVTIVVKFDVFIQFIKTFFAVLTPLFIGIAIAFILNRPYCFFLKYFKKWSKHKKSSKLPRILALITVYLAFFGVIGAIIAFIIPQLGDSVAMLYSNIDNYSATLNRWINQAAEYLKFQEIDFTTIQKYLQDIITGAGNVISYLFPQIFSFTANVIQSLVNGIMGFILSIYILGDKEHILSQIKKLAFAYLPVKAASRLKEIAGITSDVFTRFISGQATEAVILGVLCFIGMTIFKFEYALLSSTIIAVTSFIPIIGSIIGCIPAVFILLMIDPIKALWFIVFIVILQQIEGNLIYPKVLGDSIGLPPLWVFLAIIIGGGLGGVLGMILGVPTASVLYKLLTVDANKKLTLKQYKKEY